MVIAVERVDEGVEILNDLSSKYVLQGLILIKRTQQIGLWL